METPLLTEIELRRYNRQVLIEEIEENGQKKLKLAKVLVIGAGGLGIPVLQYLAAAGIGTLGICDNKYVNESNFHRQIIYGTGDLGKLKTIIAKEKLNLLNPFVNYILHNIFIDSENLNEIINDYDVIVDCTNSFISSIMISDGIKITKKPIIFGSVYHFNGIVSVLNYKGSIGLKEIYASSIIPDLFVNKPDKGNVGVITGITGLMQANEVIKILLETGSVLTNRILKYDGLNNEFLVEHV
jgi:sulfur-carrier protein adenylyltransferase/sulfurtransferase